ncbi:hypothetical protein BP6252_05287 [Coleophoma cylindrospora]|uniref:DNA mismatch repair protein HSM3 N-terminal domain-containing protein n=1 Tax=Coleophoma cylindrospora TaxID=1849047 RepID=A0A3D8RTQ4_9HELO|nr:hypothetical protein BP6252_05287 [Coleophoma cylindrospora]
MQASDAILGWTGTYVVDGSESHFESEMKTPRSANAPVKLLPRLTQILTTYERDPTILASLAIKLLRPVPFTQILTLASEESLIHALQSPAPSANVLAITVIQKASRSPGETAILSVMKGVVENFLRTWLSTPHVEVGEKATLALGELLEVDFDRRSAATLSTQMNGMEIDSNKPSGQGLLWRRIFRDKEIYELLFSLCSPETTGNDPGQLDERQKSLAQARLLRILPKLAALDFDLLTHSCFPDVEEQYLEGQERSLLYFATTEMIDKEDLLMHVTLFDFFAEFLGAMSVSDLTQSKMDYLAALLQKVTLSDTALYNYLEALATNTETPPELIDLLVRLNQYQG